MEYKSFNKNIFRNFRLLDPQSVTMKFPTEELHGTSASERKKMKKTIEEVQ